MRIGLGQTSMGPRRPKAPKIACGGGAPAGRSRGQEAASLLASQRMTSPGTDREVIPDKRS